jgi:hypothetical protein
MKFSTAIILSVFLGMMVVFAGGCHSTQGKVVGVADTKAERQNRIKEVRNTGWREFVDDWDTFWLQDKSATLSEYPVR